jgi:hypothetical protein
MALKSGGSVQAPRIIWTDCAGIGACCWAAGIRKWRNVCINIKLVREE